MFCRNNLFSIIDIPLSSMIDCCHTCVSDVQIIIDCLSSLCQVVADLFLLDHAQFAWSVCQLHASDFTRLNWNLLSTEWRSAKLSFCGGSMTKNQAISSGPVFPRLSANLKWCFYSIMQQIIVSLKITDFTTTVNPNYGWECWSFGWMWWRQRWIGARALELEDTSKQEGPFLLLPVASVI